MRWLAPWLAAALPAFVFACGDADPAREHDLADTPDASAPVDTVTAVEDADPSLAYPEIRPLTTADGALTLTLRGLGGPLSFEAVAEAELAIAGPGGAPVTGLTPTATFIHTSMGHGGARDPRVVEDGGGAYRVIDIAPSMAGHWELTLNLGPNGTVAWRVWVL